ncbi:hypothetical protein HPP92_018471 [Vanilla planifolia]|uniref:Uncharacterized protein n=1 Tax=Vanilla planifolia TaxID=51239 RepID=A0A835Q9Y7_VANPL|nr:hypothetical protein HPP92_018471 [Vanilla planifolia]
MEDENSREVYGLIKKLNIAPGTKKIAKASTSVFDSLVSQSSNSSSKSSFLNRASNSLPACQRQGSISVKAFIFGRDDSNSRNSYSTSENVADVAQKESSSRSDVTNKSNNPQRKTSTAKTMVQPGTQATSLFDILRQSSKQFDRKLESKGSDGSHVVTETQVAHQFSAFKVRRPAKMNS